MQPASIIHESRSNPPRMLSSRNPHWQRVDAWVDTIKNRLLELQAQTNELPLFVPITVTFRPMSIRDYETLREFGRFYVRLNRMLITNPDRPSKRQLLPFTVAWRDDPSTRPDKYHSRPKAISNHPGMTPHVHALMIIHPMIADRFLAIAGDLEAMWRSIPYENPCREALGSPMFRNGTLYADVPLALETRLLMVEGTTTSLVMMRDKIRACVAYSSKLESRHGFSDGADVFTVLPTVN